MNKPNPAFRLIGVGFNVAFWILLGTFGGLWLDGKFDTKPLLMMVGLFLGLIIAGISVYQLLRPMMGGGQDKEND